MAETHEELLYHLGQLFVSKTSGSVVVIGATSYPLTDASVAYFMMFSERCRDLDPSSVNYYKVSSLTSSVVHELTNGEIVAIANDVSDRYRRASNVYKQLKDDILNDVITEFEQEDTAFYDAFDNEVPEGEDAASNWELEQYLAGLTFDQVADGATNKAFTGTEKTKLSGVAAGATQNQSDSTLKARANHTGEQAISTITGLQDALDALSAAITGKANASHTHSASDITGSKTSAFISDFTEAGQDAVGGALSSEFVYNDGANSISRRAPSFTNNASHSFVTTAAAANGFQLSSDRDAAVAYDVTVSSAVQIGVGTNVAGYVVLEVAATNSATAGDWQEVARVGTGQNIALALALSSTQTVTGTLASRVPAGYYARLRTVNTNGTPTYTYLNGQEVLL